MSQDFENKKYPSKAAIQNLSYRLIIIICLFFVVLFFFAFLAHETIVEKEDLFDTNVSDFLSSFATPTIVSIMMVLTIFGSSTFLLPAYIIVIAFLLLIRKTKYAIDILIVALTGIALNHGLKFLFHRDRPDLSLIDQLTTYSFPSGHATSSFIFCSIFIYLTWKGNLKLIWKWLITIFLLAFSFSIGISRIILKAHYPSDVVAGFCVGFIWVILVYFVLNKIRWKKTRST